MRGLLATACGDQREDQRVLDDLADVIRAVDGPLVNVHDESLYDLSCPGPAAEVREVWMAARTSPRDVFERVTVEDLAAGQQPPEVVELAVRYENDLRFR